jgi:hypothetical protein
VEVVMKNRTKVLGLALALLLSPLLACSSDESVAKPVPVDGGQETKATADAAPDQHTDH